MNYETKYIFPKARARCISEHLDHRFVRDFQYPANVVTSIYFDTLNWAFYGEKLNSDYLKTKLRLRWYGMETGDDVTRCYLEQKMKIGSSRAKQRKTVEVQTTVLEQNPCRQSAIWELGEQAARDFVGLPQPLLPVAVIRYHRQRWIDPLTGSRISLDDKIQCIDVTPLLMVSILPVTLLSSVVEFKHQPLRRADPLPEATRPFVRKAAFSKYVTCLEAMIR